jgi:hypothetical protein
MDWVLVNKRGITKEEVETASRFIVEHANEILKVKSAQGSAKNVPNTMHPNCSITIILTSIFFTRS